MKKLFLIDAYAMIYRAYYAFIKRPITTTKGVDTSAIFGFTKALLEIIKKEQPTHLAVAFDPTNGKTFRRDMYPPYKTNRPKSPEVIKASVPIIKSILDAMNVKFIEMEGYEADDIIGTVAKFAETKNFTTYMMTLDKDFAQLVSENTYMYKPRSSGNDVEILGIPEVCAKYGIDKPVQMIDILAIWGDVSDNVPGIFGIGEKGAAKIVKTYGGVDGVLANVDKLSAKQQKAFNEGREQLLLSRKLVTIDTHVPIVWDEDDFKYANPDVEKVTELFREYEFSSLLREMKNDAPKPVATQATLFGNMPTENPQTNIDITSFLRLKDVKHDYQICKTSKDIDKLVRFLFDQREICFDTETDGLNPIDDKLVGISFSVKPHEGFYIPLCEEHGGSPDFLRQIKPVLENRHIIKIGQNIKFDYLFLKNQGINVQGFFFDTMIADYLLNPETRHNMTLLSEKYLKYIPIEITELIGEKGKMQKKITQVPLERLAEYSIEDVDVTIQLKNALEKLLKQNDITKLYTNIEAPLIHVLGDMESNGVRIDCNSLNEYAKILNVRLLDLDTEIKKMAGEDFNISSPKQLGIILFEKLGLSEKAKRTKTKQYSTDEATLTSMRGKHPIIDKILDFRSVKKLLSTYVEELPKMVNAKTNRIHTSFNQAVTATGRLSSTDPNLQNIPVRDDEGREIRRAFIASDENHVLISADYSQIELRIMAHLSGDRNMINAFLSGEDVHASTAAKIYHVSLPEVSRDQRRRAKTANFGIIYGISSYGLAQRLQIPVGEAKELIDGYFALYPDVKRYMDESIKKARSNGYAETIFGRRRWLPSISSNNSIVRGLAERNAINAPIQGSAADIIKIAMIRVDKRLRDEQIPAKMILQVHDELIFDVDKNEIEKAMDAIVEEMQRAAILKVPLIADAKYGDNWLEAH